MSDHSYGVASQEPHKSTMAEHSYGAPSQQPQGFGDPGLFGTFNTQVQDAVSSNKCSLFNNVQGSVYSLPVCSVFMYKNWTR